MENFKFCEEKIKEVSPLWRNYHLQFAGQIIKVQNVLLSHNNIWSTHLDSNWKKHRQISSSREVSMKR